MGREAALHAARIGERPGDQAGAAPQRQVLGQVADEEAEALTGPGVDDRREPPVQGHVVAARHRRRLRRIGRAAQEPEQRHVVHARARRPVQAQGVGDVERQQARPQAVLERLTGTEIRPQRQGDRQLGQTSDLEPLGHATTLPDARRPLAATSAAGRTWCPRTHGTGAHAVTTTAHRRRLSNGNQYRHPARRRHHLAARVEVVHPARGGCADAARGTP